MSCKHGSSCSADIAIRQNMLLAEIMIYFCISIDSFPSLPFLFLSLSFYDHTQSSLNHVHFLTMNLMPLRGNKTVLQGLETSISTADGKKITTLYKTLPVTLLLLQLRRHISLFSGKQNDAELISARECSLLIYYVSPSVNVAKQYSALENKLWFPMSAH